MTIIQGSESPSPSVLARINHIRSRELDHGNSLPNKVRHALSSSVPSIPLVDIETGCNFSQNRALFENKCELTANNVSKLSKKFDQPHETACKQLNSKNKRREIFASNRNISADNEPKPTNLSWSKLNVNSLTGRGMSVESPTKFQNQNFNEKSSTASLDIKSNQSSNSSTNINSIRVSSGSGSTVSGSSVSAVNSRPSSPTPSCSSPTKAQQMPFKIRSSKYRHVYGSAHKEDVCYKNIKITRNAAHDSAFCAVNPKFVAIVTEECGGGAFVVIPIKQTGRVDINMPKICGHRGPVLDLKWNPFNDNEIASCSEDTTIKVWQIDDDGLYENLNEWVVDLHGHQRKVNQIEWHPTAENIMISSSADCQVIVWNLEKAEPIRILTCHSDIIQSMSWTRDGSLFATTCKDKKIRLIDPRTGNVVKECDGHQGSKISKVIVLGCGTKLFTTGFSRLSERQIALWDINDLSKPIQMDIVDCSSGILIPYYDHDTKIVYVAGKGDGNIRYYEITDYDPYIHYLSEYKSSTPQRGLGFMPKRGLDVTKNEIFRFYKLHTTGNLCEPVSMIVPRKSEVFQEDIYPETLSGIPSISCEEWIAGENRDPILISLKDGAVSLMPKIVTYKQVGFSRLGTNYSRSFQSKKERPVLKNLVRTNSISGHCNSGNNSQNTVPLIEIKPITKLKANSRSAFSNYKPSQPNNSSSPPPASNNSITDSLSVNYNNDHSNLSYNTDDLTLEAMVNANLIDGISINESISLMHDSENVSSCSFRSIAKHSNDLEASYVTSMSKNPITLRKTESLKLDSVQNIRNRFNRINTNNLCSLTRKNSTKNNSYIEQSTAEPAANSFHNSIENLSKITTNTTNESSLPTVSPLNMAPTSASQTDSSDSPTPLINSTASLSSSSSSSNNGVTNIEYMNHCSVKKRVWTPVTQSNSLSHSKTSDLNASANLSELQKSYFRVKDQLNLMEKRNKILAEESIAKETILKEQLAMQEKRYQQLEDELNNKNKRIEALENKLNLLLIKPEHADSFSANESLVMDTDC